jgi:outer membrane protein assembly factor BamE
MLSALVLSACNTDKIPGVYRIDIQQGNDVSQEMISQVEVGMTKAQVTYLLGTPLLIDTFHPDRWDYLYSFHPGNDNREQRHITLFFSDDTLDSVQGDIRKVDYADLTESERQDVNVVVPLEKNKVGFFRSILNGLGLGKE